MDAAPSRRYRPDGRWWLLFAPLAAMATLWSLSTPMAGAPDEPAHIKKAVAVAHGQFQSDFERTAYPNGLVVGQTDVHVAKAYSALFPDACWFDKPAVPVSCAPPLRTDERIVSTTTYVGAYPPTYYLIVGLPSRIFRPGVALYAMRIVSGLLCAALLASGLASAIGATRRMLLPVGAAVGITPSVLFLAGSVNPNGVEIAAAFCVWTALLDLVGRPDRVPTRLLVRLTVAGALLAGSRTLSPAILAGIVAVVVVLVADRATLVRLWADARVRLAAGAMAVAAVVSAVFLVAVDSNGSLIQPPSVANPTTIDLARQAFGRTGSFSEQMIGMMSWFGFHRLLVPTWLSAAWIAVILLLMALGLAIGSGRNRLALLVTALGALLLPAAAEAASHSPGVWQGRYGLPVAVGVPILAGWAIDRSGRVPHRLARRGGLVILSGVGIGYVVAHQTLMTRNVVGLPNGLLEGLRRGAWLGPLTPAVLFAWAVVASVAYVAVLAVETGPRPWPGPRHRSRRTTNDAVPTGTAKVP